MVNSLSSSARLSVFSNFQRSKKLGDPGRLRQLPSSSPRRHRLALAIVQLAAPIPACFSSRGYPGLHLSLCTAPPVEMKELQSQPTRGTEAVVVVAVRAAAREISKTAVVWALTHVVQHGDTILLLAINPPHHASGITRFVIHLLLPIFLLHPL